MPALTGHCIGPVVFFLEVHAEGNQILYSLSSLLDDASNHGFVALTVSREKRILNMCLFPFFVGLVQNGSDTPLRPVGGGVFGPLFGGHGNVMSRICKP